MVFGWFKEHQRQVLISQPFPAEWEGFLQANVHLYGKLPSDSQKRLRDTLRVIVAEKSWEGCNGLEITEEIQVTIAAQAALLLLGIPHDYFPNVESILVYPTAYAAPQKDFDVLEPRAGTWLGPIGIVTESLSPRLGEAWGQGPVILSWPDVLAGGRNEKDGYNVVLHEFAHKLDMRDSTADGVPHLADQAEYNTWAGVMSAEYQALVDNTRHHRPTLLDQYAITNGAEFFAVATECFFERGRLMQQTHPRLYEALAGFYHQTPADWG